MDEQECNILFTMLCAQSFSCVRLFVTLWTVAHQVLLSMGFSRQGYLSGLPFPPPRDLPDPGTEPMCPVSPILQWGCKGHLESQCFLLLCVNRL